MERLSALIHKLKEQFEQNVPPTQMLGTVRQIESELSQMDSRPTNGLGSAKVAVMMPSGMRQDAHREPAPVETTAPEKNGYNGYHNTKRQEPAQEQYQPKYQPQPAVAVAPAIAAPAATASAYAYDPINEIPTLSHQEGIREINDVIGVNGDSLNDRLREERVEMAHVLTETPIRDLKKAIGVNDRYVFLNELFRGDEVMYERSIKTLNSFRIYQEAEYWINRELKIKLGWNDSNSIVRHFYHLVRRRFS